MIIYYLTSYTQPAQKLKTIANALTKFQTYQADCKYTFSIPYGDTLTVEMHMVTKMVQPNRLCNFYYDFETAEKYRNDKFNDFSIYFDSTVYSSYKGVIKKTSYKDSPSQFVDLKIQGGLVPAIQHRSSLYDKTPYQIAKQINELIKDTTLIIVQKADTIIYQNKCLRFIIETGTSKSAFNPYLPVKNDNRFTIELCFDHSNYFPVYYKKEILTSIVNSLEVASFTNTKVNFDLPSNYFTEENLLPENLDNTIKRQANNKNRLIDLISLIGKKAPEWQLPVFNQSKTFFSNSLKGKTVLLEFSATWCGHCWDAAKMMNRLENKFKNNNQIKIVSIYSSDLDSPKSIKQFSEKNIDAGLTVLYPAVEVEKKYHVKAYPTFFVISPDGIIVKIFPGYSPSLEKDIINKLTELSK